MATAYRNLETVFEYLKHIQVRVCVCVLVCGASPTFIVCWKRFTSVMNVSMPQPSCTCSHMCACSPPLSSIQRASNHMCALSSSSLNVHPITCMHILSHLDTSQAAVNNKASAYALSAVDKCLRAVGKEMMLMGRGPVTVGGHHEPAGLLYGCPIGAGHR